MWSLFSRDPAKDFNYEIGEQVAGLEEKSIWTLHQGKKKATGDPVSVFMFDVKAASESQLQIAKAAFKRIKTLRHPNILTFLDGVQTEKVIYIATEPVTPLETHLKNNEGDAKNELAISWGLHQSAKGLSFLINDCHLIHNNVCMSSLFVDQAGEWKLGGVDYMYPSQGSDSQPPIKILPSLDRYDPPEKSDSRGVKGEKWSRDMWGLGCLIWEVFNGTLPRTSSLKALGKIPKVLVPNYCELVSANPKSRPNPAKFIESCRQKGRFMDNSFVTSMLFLEEIQIKDQNEKTKFFSSLTPSLDSFPPQFCRHKILPQLLNAFEYSNAGSSVLAPMFKLAKYLDPDEYQKKMVPCVVKLFSSSDRATRVKLLQQIEFFVEHLQVGTVNDQIFPNVVHGFMDTNPVVRESTIKAMVHLAPKLNYKNLNEELMKHFARLQTKDDQGGIRTNTTVCLGKIGHFLNPQIRQKILCSAFLRSLKDPFPPARQGGVLALAATQNLYSLKEVAMRLLPALCCMTMDPEKGVRDQTFKAINGFLTKLEKVSENPELLEELEREVATGGTMAGGAAGWAGWAVTGMSSLTTKFYQKATKKPAAAPVTSNPVSAPSSATTRSEAEQRVPHKELVTKELEEEKEEEEEEENQTAGWDAEDWGDMEDFGDSTREAESPLHNEFEHKDDDDGWDNDDEDWGTIEDTLGPAKSSLRSSEAKSGHSDFTSDSSGLPSTGAYNWGGTDNSEDFFSSTLGTSKPTRPRQTTPQRTTTPPQRKTTPPKESQKKMTTPKQDSSSGWEETGGWDVDDDSGWGGDEWNSADTAKKKSDEREERRLQRQRELQAKREQKKAGAMKLGAKRLG
ncbi:N-terminal kinase-like protein [Gigantopelta aegis]|uniref:N-terminal kinase-like protein n=1 Tax=Gigantopelta aegis TaxID=1735272 RepID=UPI001B88B3F3|nr:N-terminal kinase-like protein [Gigantopelta aegis]